MNLFVFVKTIKMAGQGDMGGIMGFLGYIGCIFICIIFFIAGVCLIAIPTVPPHQLTRPSIPATLLEIPPSECVNSTTVGIFQLNPAKGSGLNKHVMNISYSSCMCDTCDYWSPPPTCCERYVNVTNIFIVTINRDNYEDPDLEFNENDSDGRYMSEGGSDRHGWGWGLFAVSMLLLIILVSIPVALWWEERKKQNNYETV